MGRADYNTSSISFDTDEMHAQGGVMTTIGGLIEDELAMIEDAVFKLKLGWVGDSQKEADNFNFRWQLAMKSLFGTGKESSDPSKPPLAADEGVLNEMAGGVKGAAAGYSSIEDELMKGFNKFFQGLNAPASGPDPMTDANVPTPHNQPTIDPATHQPVPSAVTETFPGN